MKAIVGAAALVVMGCSAAEAADQTGWRIAETVWLERDAPARVEVVVDLPARIETPVRVPLSGPIDHIAIEGPPGVAVACTGAADGRVYAVISLGARTAAPIEVRMTGEATAWQAALSGPTAAFGNRTVAYRWVDSVGTVFERASGEIVLPPGFVVTAISGSEPAASASSPSSPVAVVGRDGRHAVRIGRAAVAPGDAVAVTFRYQERHGSWTGPAILLALATLYLVGFRQLVHGVTS